MKASEVRERTTDDLVNLEKELQRDLFKARLGNSTNQLESTATIGALRRDIARVKTILSERAAKDGNS